MARTNDPLLTIIASKRSLSNIDHLVNQEPNPEALQPLKKLKTAPPTFEEAVDSLFKYTKDEMDEEWIEGTSRMFQDVLFDGTSVVDEDVDLGTKLRILKELQDKLQAIVFCARFTKLNSRISGLALETLMHVQDFAMTEYENACHLEQFDDATKILTCKVLLPLTLRQLKPYTDCFGTLANETISKLHLNNMLYDLEAVGPLFQAIGHKSLKTILFRLSKLKATVNKVMPDLQEQDQAELLKVMENNRAYFQAEWVNKLDKDTYDKVLSTL